MDRYPFLVIPTGAKRSGGTCGSADPSWRCFSTEQSWACGPPKVMKNASVRRPLSMEPLPFPCHPDRSEAERRDLRFRRPIVEMFFDRAVMGLRPTQGNEKRLGPASTLYGTVTLSLSSRPERR